MAFKTTSLLLVSTFAAATSVFAADAPDSALAIDVKSPKLAWGPCPDIFPKGCKIAVLHGDPTKPNADIFLQVPPKYKIPAHWHTSPERMVLVTGKLKVTYMGQAPAILQVGNYAYGPSKQPHEGECLSKVPCTLFIAFEGPVDGYASN